VRYTWEANWSNGENVSFVAFDWALDAVGCHQDCAWKLCEFCLLMLPCRSVMSVKVAIFLESWVAMSCEHFAVCVNGYAFFFGLLSYLF